MIVYALYCDNDSNWFDDLDDDEIDSENIRHFSATVARTHVGAAVNASNEGYAFNETNQEYEEWTVIQFDVGRL